MAPERSTRSRRGKNDGFPERMPGQEAFECALLVLLVPLELLELLELLSASSSLPVTLQMDVLRSKNTKY